MAKSTVVVLTRESRANQHEFGERVAMSVGVEIQALGPGRVRDQALNAGPAGHPPPDSWAVIRARRRSPSSPAFPG